MNFHFQTMKGSILKHLKKCTSTDVKNKRKTFFTYWESLIYFIESYYSIFNYKSGLTVIQSIKLIIETTCILISTTIHFKKTSVNFLLKKENKERVIGSIIQIFKKTSKTERGNKNNCKIIGDNSIEDLLLMKYTCSKIVLYQIILLIGTSIN